MPAIINKMMQRTTMDVAFEFFIFIRCGRILLQGSGLAPATLGCHRQLRHLDRGHFNLAAGANRELKNLR